MKCWEKLFHGQQSLVQDQPNLWLRWGELSPETEGFIAANQDKLIGSMNYQKHILCHNVADKSRLCASPNETIKHIIDDSRILNSRYNDVCGIVDQQIGLNLSLLQDWKP